MYAPLVGVVATHRGESLKQALQQCCCSNADVDVSMESSENPNETLLLAMFSTSSPPLETPLIPEMAPELLPREDLNYLF